MEREISNIVFTKNRPLQLEGYLRGLYRHFPGGLVKTYILYKRQFFDEEYGEVFAKYPECVVVREEDFSRDFFKILSQVSTKYILFGVDDVVYFDSVDFDVIDETFERFGEDIFGFSLRFGDEMIGKGGDVVTRTDIGGQVVCSLDWHVGQMPATRYPFELCATVYRTGLVRAVIEGSRHRSDFFEKIFAPDSGLVSVLGGFFGRHSVLKRFGYFYNPNTLESWNCRWCQRNRFGLGSLLFFQKVCASAIQVNMVNSSTDNSFDGGDEQTVECLNDKYKQGYRLDVDFVAENRPVETHCGQEKFRIVKG